MTICSCYVESVAGALVGEGEEEGGAVASISTALPIIFAKEDRVKVNTDAELRRNVINIAFRRSRFS